MEGVNRYLRKRRLMKPRHLEPRQTRAFHRSRLFSLQEFRYLCFKVCPAKVDGRQLGALINYKIRRNRGNPVCPSNFAVPSFAVEELGPRNLSGLHNFFDSTAI